MSATLAAVGGKSRKPLDLDRLVAENVEEMIAEHASCIRAGLGWTVDAIVGTGRAILNAKANLPHGAFEEAIRQSGISPGTARKYMAIAQHPILRNHSHANDLPPRWDTLYQLAILPEDILVKALGDGRINPGMLRKDLQPLVQERNQRRMRERSASENAGVAPAPTGSMFLSGAPPVDPLGEFFGPLLHEFGDYSEDEQRCIVKRLREFADTLAARIGDLEPEESPA
jgi:hypothetical protein